ncbi:MAG TPA: hypothetical protein VGI29_06320 [Candidatus Binataceae bacterium]
MNEPAPEQLQLKVRGPGVEYAISRVGTDTGAGAIAVLAGAGN